MELDHTPWLTSLELANSRFEDARTLHEQDLESIACRLSQQMPTGTHVVYRARASDEVVHTRGVIASEFYGTRDGLMHVELDGQPGEPIHPMQIVRIVAYPPPSPAAFDPTI